ncbi:hypothetical protein Patl1_17688 [Pistacia atlantica]|uniref:Uncharacterized protein n=1 Tax=Pistacia atlantica TaxID=434234 RepID=A0ACC1C1E8_9ROSI|nr:hypothetical protein Patl1_17688 [Pistacia atlantica]
MLAEKPVITDDSNQLDSSLLDELLANIATLSSVYHKPPEAFVTHTPTLVADGGTSPQTSSSSAPYPAGRQPAPPPAAPAPAAPVSEFIKGLQISAQLTHQDGQVLYSMLFENNTQIPLDGFMIQFNKNTFGLAGRHCCLWYCSRMCLLVLQAPLQVAVKNNQQPVWYFNDKVSLHLFFTEDGRMERASFLGCIFLTMQTWRSLPDSNEVLKDLPGIVVSNVEATLDRLTASNMFFIAKRKHANQDAFYFSSKIPRGITFLIELTTIVRNPGLKCAIKTPNHSSHCTKLSLAKSAANPFISMDASSFLHPPTPRPIPPSLPHQHHHAPPPPPPTSATIANPTPPFLNHNNIHPPYTEMISSAITALKEKDGSSMRAIAKYIGKVYANSLPPNHAALLSQHLKQLKNTGQLVMVKKSYKLARSAELIAMALTPENATAISSAHGPKTGRGRGRPPKANSDSVSASLGLVDQPKRGPGRPKKGDVVIVATCEPNNGRCRPPKAEKRGPGRPKKLESVTGKLGLGRPPNVQAQGQEQLNPVAVTYAASDTNVPVAIVNVAKPRGRPRKIGTTLAAAGDVKQRVPPAKKAVSRTGRPVGRPKKVKGVNLARLGTNSLRRYCRHYRLVNINSDSSREQLLDAAQRHFASQPPLSEVHVISEFIDAVKTETTDTYRE